MPRPAWYDELNALKWVPIFSWSLQLRILHLKNPKRYTRNMLNLARSADAMYRLDRSGHTVPFLLHKLFLLCNEPKKALTCQRIYSLAREQERQRNIQQHPRRTPLRTWPTEPIDPNPHPGFTHTLVESASGIDLEQFPLHPNHNPNPQEHP